MGTTSSLPHGLHSRPPASASAGAGSPPPTRLLGIGGLSGSPLPISALAAGGCNAMRTWGTDQLSHKWLADAHRAGVCVFAGLWVDRAPLSAATEKELLASVDAFKQQPAIAGWIVGNEVELRCGEAAAFAGVAGLAAKVRARDPSRQVAYAVADIGDHKAAALQAACGPNIDLLLINTYGGMPSLPRRLKAQGYTGKWGLGEWGCRGPWEVGKAPWGAALQDASTETAVFAATAMLTLLREAATNGTLATFVGGFGFFGGYKVEATPTWFSLVMKTGEVARDRIMVFEAVWAATRSETVLATAEMLLRPWTEARTAVAACAAAGAPACLGVGVGADEHSALGRYAQACRGSSIVAQALLGSGQPSSAVEWQLMKEGTDTIVPATVSVLPGDGLQCRIALPAVPGDYRLHAFVRRAGGLGSGFATGNAPIRIT